MLPDPAPDAWSTARRPSRPVVAVVSALVAVVVAAVGVAATPTSRVADAPVVSTMSVVGAVPGQCRAATVFAVGGTGPDVTGDVTAPLAQRLGDRLEVVAVPPPSTGTSYAAAQQEAVGSLSTRVTDVTTRCPDSRLLLVGYSEGAHVAGDLASRVGTGQERGIPAERVLAVGLFGDPARSPFTRVVPSEAGGQGVLPPRAAGFGTLEQRTIEVCAPQDPVCDSPAQAAFPSLEEALKAPPHAAYPQLPVARSLTATQWASDSLGALVERAPATAPPASAPPPSAPPPSASTTTTAAPSTSVSLPGAGLPPATASATPSTTTGATTTGATTTATTTTATTTTATSGGGATASAGGATASAGAGVPGGATASAGAGATGTAEQPTTSGGAPTTTSGGAATTTTSGARPSATSGGAERTTTSGARPGATSGGAERTTTSGRAGRSTTTSGSATSGSGTSTTTVTDGQGGQDGGGDPTDTVFALAGTEGFDLGQGGNVENGETPVAAPSPNVPGRQAVKLELPAGGRRSEVRPDGAAQDIKAGERRFFGWSAFLPDGFPVDARGFQVVWQLHDGETDTSPPVALEIQQGRLWLANVGDLVQDLGPVAAGTNVAVQMDIEFAVGGGSVSLWRDGEQKLDRFRPPKGTMIDGFDFLKTGIYRDDEGAPATSLFLNDLKIGDSLEAVSPLAGAPAAPVGGSG